MTLIRHSLAAALALGLVAAPGRAVAQTEIDKAIDRLDKATKALDDARKVMTDLSELRGKLITAESEIAILKQDVRDLRQKFELKSTTALKPDASTSFRGQGRLRFINEHPMSMSVVVNGLSHRLAPGAEKLIPVPPGEYTYQVLQLHNTPRVKRIEADEVKTFTIYAQD